MTTPFVEEFLYRGRGDGSSAWHVVLASEVDDGLGGSTLVRRGPLTPAQAEAAGFSLDTVIADINTAALARGDALQAQVEALTAQLAQHETE